MAVAVPYAFSLVNDSGLEASQNSIRILGFSVASQLMLQESSSSGVLEWGPIPAALQLSATLANGAGTISWSGGLPAFMAISVGDQVTGSGIPPGTTVTAISAQVTLTEAATSTGTSPATVETVILVGGTATLGAGRPVTGSGVPAGTTVVSIDSSGTIGLSSPATATGSQSLTFAPATGVIPSFDIDQY